MKKTLSFIFGFIAFILMLSESEDINVMIVKTLICGAVLLFLLYINGFYALNSKDRK